MILLNYEVVYDDRAGPNSQGAMKNCKAGIRCEGAFVTTFDGNSFARVESQILVEVGSPCLYDVPREGGSVGSKDRGVIGLGYAVNPHGMHSVLVKGGGYTCIIIHGDSAVARPGAGICPAGEEGIL